MKFRNRWLIVGALIAVLALCSVAFAHHTIDADSTINTSRGTAYGTCNVSYSAYTTSSVVADRVVVLAKIYRDSVFITQAERTLENTRTASVAGSLSNQATGWWEIASAHGARASGHNVTKASIESEYCSGGVT